MLFNRINNWLTGHPAITGLLLFLLCLIFFGWLEYSWTLADPDSFYHIKIAKLIGEQGLVYDFPYLPFTTLKTGYIDHHLLYHLYLVPFVKLFSPLIGAKIGHILLVSLALLTLYWLLVKFKVLGAQWYIIFLFFVEPFIFRLGLVKAQPLSLLILFLGIYLIIQQKYYWLTLLSVVYVWSYGGWFLMFILAGVYVLVASLDLALTKTKDHQLSRVINWRPKKTDIIDRFYIFLVNLIKNIFRLNHIKLVASVMIGLILGLVINPYFPKNLEFYYIHIIKIALVNYQAVIGVGAEWYPYAVSDFFINNALPFGLSLVAIFLFLNYHRHFNLKAKYTLALLLVFILATIKSRRNIEYIAPLAVIFSALTFSQAMTICELKNDLKEFKRIVVKVFFHDCYTRILLVVVVVVVIGGAGYQMPYQAKQSLGHGFNFNYLKSASDYLASHSQTGDVVVHSDWDEFPVLFYHNSKNYYMAGLDPTFMYLFNQDLYTKWVAITRGQNTDELFKVVSEDFGAKYVLATTDHQEMIRSLDNNIFFAKVYSDSEAVIYQVLNQLEVRPMSDYQKIGDVK